MHRNMGWLAIIIFRVGSINVFQTINQMSFLLKYLLCCKFDHSFCESGQPFILLHASLKQFSFNEFFDFFFFVCCVVCFSLFDLDFCRAERSILSIVMVKNRTWKQGAYVMLAIWNASTIDFFTSYKIINSIRIEQRGSHLYYHDRFYYGN